MWYKEKGSSYKARYNKEDRVNDKSNKTYVMGY